MHDHSCHARRKKPLLEDPSLRCSLSNIAVSPRKRMMMMCPDSRHFVTRFPSTCSWRDSGTRFLHTASRKKADDPCMLLDRLPSVHIQWSEPKAAKGRGKQSKKHGCANVVQRGGGAQCVDCVHSMRLARLRGASSQRVTRRARGMGDFDNFVTQYAVAEQCPPRPIELRYRAAYAVGSV